MIFQKQQRDPTVIGIEITAQNVKLLALTAKENSYEVSHYATAPLPAHAMLNNDIKDYMAVGSAIKTAYQQGQFSTKSAVTAVTGSNVMIKKITLDANLSATDMEEQAWMEAGKIFPNLIDNIQLDFTILEPNKTNKDQLEVLLVACRTEQVQMRVDALEEANLITRAVDVDYYAYERCLALLLQQLPNKENIQITALLNINATSMTLVVLENLNSLYAHDQTFDGQILQEKCAALKLNNATATEADIVSSTEIFNQYLLPHLRHFFQYFYSTHAQKEIQHLFLSGECATISHIAALMTQQMGIPTMIANPFVNLSATPNVDFNALQLAAPSWVLCFGLALHPIKL